MWWSAGAISSGSSARFGVYVGAVQDHDDALQALDRFTDLYATGELPEFHSIVDTIIAWGDEILAWHDTGRPSNGRIEGTNNLPDVLRRPRPHQRRQDAARGLLVT